MHVHDDTTTVNLKSFAEGEIKDFFDYLFWKSNCNYLELLVTQILIFVMHVLKGVKYATGGTKSLSSFA